MYNCQDPIKIKKIFLFYNLSITLHELGPNNVQRNVTYLAIEKFEEDPDGVISIIGVKPLSVQRIGDLIGKSKLRCK